jgi:hypothetical protein
MSYPNSIKGELIKEFAMEKPKESIFYLKPDDGSKNKELSLDIKDDSNSVANHLLDWVDKVNDDKKDVLQTILKNQEEYLKKLGDK